MVVIRWLLVTAYVAFIFIFSQSPASSAGSMADWLLNMFSFLDNYDLGMVVLYLRKLIHIGGYFLLQFYSMQLQSIASLGKISGTHSFHFGVLLAVCDESYQTRLTHRSALSVTFY